MDYDLVVSFKTGKRRLKPSYITIRKAHTTKPVNDWHQRTSGWDEPAIETEKLKTWRVLPIHFTFI